MEIDKSDDVGRVSHAHRRKRGQEMSLVGWASLGKARIRNNTISVSTNLARQIISRGRQNAGELNTVLQSPWTQDENGV